MTADSTRFLRERARSNRNRARVQKRTYAFVCLTVRVSCRLLPHCFSRVCGDFVRQWPFWVFLFYFRSLHVWASVALWNEGGHFSPSSQMTSARPSPTRLSPHFASRPVLLFPARRVTFLWRPLNHSNHVCLRSPRRQSFPSEKTMMFSHLLSVFCTFRLYYTGQDWILSGWPSVYTCLRGNRWPLHV